MTGALTSLSQCLICESSLPHLKRVPFAMLDPFINIYDMQILIHPKLMYKFPHQHRPMLCRIRVFSNALCDTLSYARLFQASHAGNRMPSDCHGA